MIEFTPGDRESATWKKVERLAREKIEEHQAALEGAVESLTIYRIQGRISALRELIEDVTAAR